jgi:hypothetical protein
MGRLAVRNGDFRPGQPPELLELPDVVQVKENARAMDAAAYSDGALCDAGVTTAGLEGVLLCLLATFAKLAATAGDMTLEAAVAGATLFELLGGAAHSAGCASPATPVGFCSICQLAPAAELATIAFAGCSPKERALPFTDTVQIFVRLSEGRTVAVDIEAPGVSETGGWLRVQLEARIASSLRIPLRESGRKK